MPAQQKPKKVQGTRNSDRRNGKARSDKTDWSKMEKHGGEWRPKAGETYESTRVKPKKPTGRTILGYSRKRFAAMAAAKGMSVDGLKAVMVEERDAKKAATRANRLAFRTLIKGAESLYRDGTLKHGPTPVLNRKAEATA